VGDDAFEGLEFLALAGVEDLADQAHRDPESIDASPHRPSAPGGNFPGCQLSPVASIGPWPTP
jgi:hypothetical protein